MSDVVKGTPGLVRNLATVVPGEKPIYNIVAANGRPVVLVNVLHQPDGTALAIADAVNRTLRDITARGHPACDVLRSIHPRARIDFGRDREHLIGHVLSALVLTAFLGDWPATLVAALVIPIAASIAIVFMRLFMSFNLMTLGGIAACIGVGIDDAIVMVKNISSICRWGNRPADASRSAIVELTPN